MRLRQVALVTCSLERAVADLESVLGLEVGFRDPAVSVFGLRNAVLPVGETFLEVLEPARDETAAERFLERRRKAGEAGRAASRRRAESDRKAGEAGRAASRRRAEAGPPASKAGEAGRAASRRRAESDGSGDGGYMVILQTSDLGSARAHASERGVRVAWEVALDDAAAVHLHPRDVGGAILSFDWMARPDLWRWAGPEWRRHVRTEVVRRIAGVDLQAEDWRRLARRWAEVVGRPLVDEVEGRPRVDETALHLDEGVLRFGPPEDERGTGIVRVVLECADAPRALAAARARGLPVREDGGAPEVSIAGTWLQLASRATGGGTR